VFAKALRWVLKEEGGYVNDPHDQPTNFGITQRTFSKWLGQHGLEDTDIKEITREEVWQIYHDWYWKEASQMRWPIALMHFDAVVNLTRKDAGVVLQRALNTASVPLHKQMLVLDGIVGPKTLARADLLAWAPRLKHEILHERRKLYLKKVREDRNKERFLWQWGMRLEHLYEAVV